MPTIVIGALLLLVGAAMVYSRWPDDSRTGGPVIAIGLIFAALGVLLIVIGGALV